MTRSAGLQELGALRHVGIAGMRACKEDANLAKRQERATIEARGGEEEGSDQQSTYLLAACMPNPPRCGGTKVSMIGRGSVGCDILCLRVELVLERGSLELMDERPWPPEFVRLNHLFVKSVKPFEGDAERGVLRKLAGDEGEGVVASGGLRVLETLLRGAMGPVV